MYTDKKQWYHALEESLGLEQSDLDDLATILLETLPEALNALEQAQAPKDDLQRHAHTIKGSAGNLGLIQLSKFADELEILVLKGGAATPEYRNKLLAIQTEFAAFTRLMKS